MIKYENDCVDCGLPCRGSSCHYRNVKHLYCDICGEDIEELFEHEGEQYCYECLMNAVKKITLDD